MLPTRYLPFTFLLFLSFTTLSLFGNTVKAPADNAFGVILEQFPSNKHFYPRDLFTNKGTAIAKGKVYGISGYEQLRIKL